MEKKYIWLIAIAIITLVVYFFYYRKGDQKVQFISFNTQPVEQISELMSRQYVYGKRSMLCRWDLKKGALVPRHKHPNEQITYITSGSVRVTTEGREIIVSAGELLVIPPNTYHEFLALEDTIDIDVFSPPRRDWINKTDTYLQRK